MNEPASDLRAVLDLGSNTFHLLIATVRHGRIVAKHYQRRIYVKLAAAGADRISPAAWARGLGALEEFRSVLARYDHPRLRVFGTAMFRSASNGPAFQRALTERGFPVEIISGEREADLIRRGVISSLPPASGRVLIMDIGGGSTEFIIAEGQRTHYARSFPVGLAALHRRFHTADPFPLGQRTALHDFLVTTLAPLLAALRHHPTDHLVGAAGAFEVLLPAGEETVPAVAVDSDYPERLVTDLLPLTTAERGTHRLVPAERADYIIVALLLMAFVRELSGTQRLTVSRYALKEGALLDPGSW